MWASAGLAQGKAPDRCEVCNALYSLYVLSGIKHLRLCKATHLRSPAPTGIANHYFP
jgi:hypothetical protein